MLRYVAKPIAGVLLLALVALVLLDMFVVRLDQDWGVYHPEDRNWFQRFMDSGHQGLPVVIFLLGVVVLVIGVFLLLDWWRMDFRPWLRRYLLRRKRQRYRRRISR